MTERFSSFSIILIMAVMSFIGVISIPMLNLQYTPSKTSKSISVTFSYPDASPETVEAEVTSKIEGIMAGISGCTGTSSLSSYGSGRVTAQLDKHTDMAAARMELASALRNIRADFPSEVSYPSISHNSKGEKGSVDIIYYITGTLPPHEIEKYAKEQILPTLSTIKGVERIELNGTSQLQWVITIDTPEAASLGISIDDITSAVNDYFSESQIGVFNTETGSFGIRLSCNDGNEFGSIPIKKSDGRIIWLRDIAEWEYQETPPTSYLRINGLNTVTMSIDISSDANLLSVTKEVKSRMAIIKELFHESIAADLAYDATEFVRNELNKIFVRTALCIAILLLFIFMVCRSWRYLVVIFISLSVNILICITIYAFLGIDIHIYTLAGITASVSFTIDSSIMMIDHYGHFHNRKVFPSLAAATVTTIGVLMTVLLLPEEDKVNLIDFIFVISLNLSVSLVVSWMFIPALMKYFPILTLRKLGYTPLRKRVDFHDIYIRYINWGTRHRWLYIVVFIIAFGIPLFLLPDSAEMKLRQEKNFIHKGLERIINWEPYKNNKNVIDKIAGSSIGAFYRSLNRSDFFKEPAKKELRIYAGMPEGCTVAQLNALVIKIEDYLSLFEGISIFRTEINSYSDALITIEFKEGYEDTAFPHELKSNIIDIARNYGGASWSIFGTDDANFSINVNHDFVIKRISINGYSYSDLKQYAEYLISYLSSNPRIHNIELWGAIEEGRPKTEWNLSYNLDKMSPHGFNPYIHHSGLSSYLYEGRVGDVVLKSSELDRYDRWDIMNSPVLTSNGQMALAGNGTINKRQTGISISKINQSYELNVCFDFSGNNVLYKKTVEDAVRHMNNIVLPVGYKAKDPSNRLEDSERDNYVWIILVAIALIYVILAMTFESFRLPLAIIFMIPISFIGVFIAFGLSDLNFDQGGFAASVMLCGITINAGIYLLMTYKDLCRSIRTDNAGTYIRAFRRKITPIMLTIISTILGLLPFLSEGPHEVFWFNFAVGTLAGLLFSLIALLFVLPVFTVRHSERHPD